MLSRQNGAGVEALVPFFMLILLAESKTMASQQKQIDPSVFDQHTPVFEEVADAIMANIEQLSPGDISEILGVSHQLAIKSRSLAYDFPHKLTGYQALYGFTGEAFKGLDATSLSEDGVNNAFQDLKFVSSVYGWLNASDIIKPYRCEFNKPIAPGRKTPIEVFKPKNTVELVKEIKERKIQDVINLLPGDADKCIDWKIARAFAKVHKVCFRVLTPDGNLKTPLTHRLKELRGLMARTILNENIQSFKELTEIESDHFVFSPVDSKPLLPVFISD